MRGLPPKSRSPSAVRESRSFAPLRMTSQNWAAHRSNQEADCKTNPLRQPGRIIGVRPGIARATRHGTRHERGCESEGKRIFYQGCGQFGNVQCWRTRVLQANPSREPTKAPVAPSAAPACGLSPSEMENAAPQTPPEISRTAREAGFRRLGRSGVLSLTNSPSASLRVVCSARAESRSARGELPRRADH